MNRKTFIQQLVDALSYRVKPHELHSIIEYYDEMIQDLMEEGYTEADAIHKLGSAKELADEVAPVNKEIKLDVPKRWHPGILLLLVIGFPLWGSLLLAGVCLLACVYLVIWCVPFITGILGVSAIFGGLVSSVLSPLAMSDALFYGVTQLGLGVLLFGLGIICTIFTLSISRWFTYATRQVSMFTSKFVFGARKQQVRYEN